MQKFFNIFPDYEKSHKSYVHDTLTGSEFFDTVSMFSSLPLGYNHKIFDDSFKKKVVSICAHKVSNTIFKSNIEEEFINKLLETTTLKNIHICATGSLAVEAAIKSALVAHDGKRKEILSLKNGFHGIYSWGTLTDYKASFAKKRLEFMPRLTWPRLDIEQVETYLLDNPNLAGIILELVQCTAGDIYLPIKILKTIRKICKENNICFIVDEIQTGMGTTGNYWYSVQKELNPDIIIFGKKCQVSGILSSDVYSFAINSKNRYLNVTFDGDLIDLLRANYIMSAIKQYNLLDNITLASSKIKSALFPLFENYRSQGSLICFDFKSKKIRDIFVSMAYKHFLLVNPTGEKSLRMRLHLAIDELEIEDLISKIKSSIKEI